MRWAILWVGVLVAGSGCTFGSGGGSSAEPTGRCMPTSSDPWRGIAAISEDYRVRVWDTGTQAFTELPMVGDDPRNERVEGDLNVVETVSVHPTTCRAFVGTCCEPVSGVTYFDVADNADEWKYVFGHYPSISPDGTRIALSSYEELTVASVDSPETPTINVRQPSPEEATIYDLVWLDDDALVLFGVTSDGAYLWKVDLAEKALGAPVLLTEAVSSSSGDVWSTGIVGVDSNGLLVSRAPVGMKTQMQHRSATTLQVESTETMDVPVRSYRVNGDRAVRVTETGVLQVRTSDDAEWATVGSGTDRYVWAG